MRNVTAEKNLLEKIFLIAGFCLVLGILVLALGSEIWLISVFFADDLPVFLVLQGVWLILLGTTLALVASLIQKNQRP